MARECFGCSFYPGLKPGAIHIEPRWGSDRCVKKVYVVLVRVEYIMSSEGVCSALRMSAWCSSVEIWTDLRIEYQ